MAEHLFVISIFLFAAGSLFALCFYGWQRLGNFISLILGAIASCFSIATAVIVLCCKTPVHIDFQMLPPIIKHDLLLDPLSSYFILAISVISLVACIYSIGYIKIYIGKRDIRFLGFLYNLFLLSMLLVVSANNALIFMIVWELMTFLSYFLVIFEHEDQANRKAGLTYIIMAHIGSGLIAIAFFILLSYAGSFSFDDFRKVASHIPVVYKNIIFFLILFGFGIKAGIFPLHLWLPMAHPAAPGNVSMVMSGVMIKTAIYGFIRFYFEFVTPCPPWWGVIVLVFGAASALLGILYALQERDIKTMLAYSSIENIGIILIGVGLSMIFRSYGLMPLSSLAMIAGLYHLINHAVFKCLLFGCAGNVYYATHTKNIEELGGLIKRLHVTAPLFLTAALSISAIPPLNGFMSEWLIFQSILNGFNIPSVLIKIETIICGAVVALTGALVATCFVRAFGISFLAMPRSERAKHAKEVPVVMYASMGLLAGLCVFMGFFPARIMATVHHVSEHLLGVNIIGSITAYDWMHTKIVQTNFSGLSPKSATVFGLMLLAITFGALTAIRPGFVRKFYETWTCGISPEPRFEYTATAFSRPFAVIFKGVLGTKSDVIKVYSVPNFFVKSMTYVGEFAAIFDKYLYAPVSHFVLNTSDRVRWIHTGNIRVYLAYIFITLIILIMFFR